LTIPANSLSVGDTLIVEMSGFFTSGGNTITLRSKLAGTTQATSAFTAPTATSGSFHVRLMLTLRTTGSSGTMIAQGYCIFSISASPQTGSVFAFTPQTATFTINTTIANTYDLTAQNIGGAGTRTLTSTNFTLFKRKV
jgi:hypothetical protein